MSRSSEALEIERKFEVAPTTAMADLAGVPGVHRVEVLTFPLVAEYFDTDDLRLLRAGITLRRRTGGDDDGWHLKLPKGADRSEIALPLDASSSELTPPTDLLDRVRVQLRGGSVGPVATLRTERVVSRLVDADGTELVEVADDRVSSSAGADGTAHLDQWREWEVELKDPSGEDVLAAVSELLVEAGAEPADRRAKLDRALADRVPARRPSASALAADLSADGPAGAVVLAHLADQAETLLAYDPKVRADEADSIHKMRVATRRMRSALSTFRPLLDRAVTDPIRDELKWLAAVLGVARDAEVQRDFSAGLVAAEPVELVMGPVAATLDHHWTSVYQQAHAEVVVTLDSTRYFTLLDRLEALITEPPLLPTAERPAGPELTRLTRRAYQRLAAAVDEIEHPPAVLPLGVTEATARDHHFHEARKAAKRLRYAAEAITPVLGDRAEALAAAAEDLQEVLGEHQDSVVAREWLREFAVQAFLRGENPFTYGRLHALEQARADRAETLFEPAWAALSATKMRGWLKGKR
ncbi:CYTH and CHAD domain-containing protein [Nakamurella leprariae]|uniref:CYTH and CHAD domain-containing protein n=1 Tax=Nakamurella leprariae TaxID=2803911 RepID=A0A938YE86_9ACTN|nr:CYTH and CHAD domain-containing protein [Nakamurella leprariae]MBM9467946.1 CYTH and CHAD domain-containing protein [Nakamurella leprariae]